MQDAVVLVILGQQPERVGLDAQVDVFAHQDGLALGLGLLDAEGQRQDAVIHRVRVENSVAVPGGSGPLKYDAEVPAVGQRNAFAQPARAAKAVQHAGDRPGVLAQFGGLALEAVNFLDDLNGQEDVVILELEQGIGVMEQDIGIKNVILLHDGSDLTWTRVIRRCQFLEASVRGGQPIVPRIKEVGEHAVEIEIHEPWPLVQQEGLVQQHFLKRNQPLLQLGQQILLLRPPLVDAPAPELAFLVAQKRQLVGGRDHLLPVNVVELEADAFDLVFDVLPEDGLHAFQPPGEQPELELGVEVLGDDLGILADLENDGFAVPDDRHAVVALSGQPPDQGAVTAGNIGDLEAGTGELEDAALDNAEGTPGKLNEFNHVVRCICADIGTVESAVRG